MTTPTTIAYLEAENAYADQYFAEPARAALVETVFQEIKSRVQETDLSVPVLHGGWWYVTRTIEGKSYPVFCRSRDPEVPDTPDTVILDCNAEAEGHEYFDVHDVEPSPDHTLLAWSSDVDGSERYTLRVRDLDTGDDADEITGTSSWGGVAWSAGNDWLFYARPDDQMRPYQIWRHRLGTPPEPTTSSSTARTTSGSSSTSRRRAASAGSSSPRRRRRAASPSSCAPTIRKGRRALVRARTPDVEYGIDDWGDRFVVLTNLDAPDFRLMAAPHDDPGAVVGPRRPRSRPPAHRGRAVRRPPRRARVDGTPSRGSACCAATARPRCSTSATNRTTSPSAPIRSGTTSTLRLSYQSLTTPQSVFDHDLATGERVLRKQTPTPGVDLDCVRRRAHVGDRRRRRRRSRSTSSATGDTPLDGTAPCVVYAYGAYEYSLAPWFSVARLSLLDRGVAFALVHPRGGGELGRSWYLDGKLLNKRNTFTDTIAASDHLVAERLRRRRTAGAARRQRRRPARRGVHHDAPGALRRRRRRGALRRRRHDDERSVAAADGDGVGGVGRSPRRAVRQLHRRLLAVRQHDARRLSGDLT